MVLNPTSQTYDSLLLAYRFMNDVLFSGILPTCLLTLQREKKTYGYFCSSRFKNAADPEKTTDEIALNPQFFRSEGRDDQKVVSTLVHEMVHLWQYHYGKPGRARYHNKEWADKMKSIGLVPSSTGDQGGRETGDHMSHYIESKGIFARSFEDLKVQGFRLEWIESPYEENCSPLPPLPLPVVGPDDDPTDIINPILVNPKPDKSNRLKYTCPQCSLNAWAKPGANLICGNCEELMIFSM